MDTSLPLIIVGAGPAGLFTAIQAAGLGLKALILEKMPLPGRKLLLTGGGACNFTNARPIREFMGCYGQQGKFLKPALLNFTNTDVQDFFEKLGVPSLAEPETRKVFPSSRRARDILDSLLKSCQELGVDLRAGEPAQSVMARDQGGFDVRTPRSSYTCQRLVLATGGKSYPSTGSTGDGYALAQSLGHAIVEPRPGLSPVFISNHPLSDLSGTSFENLEVTLWRGDKKLAKDSGGMVVTHQGLSGPVIHNLARAISPGDRLCLAFLPDLALGDFDKVGVSLEGFLRRPPLTKALAKIILDLAGLKPETAPERLDQGRRRGLAKWLSAFPLIVNSVDGFEKAMVTCGGVCLDEVNPKTMESRKRKGLYFTGELLDLDGDSGGYDLQAAWSTAALAAKNMAGD